MKTHDEKQTFEAYNHDFKKENADPNTCLSTFFHINVSSVLMLLFWYHPAHLETRAFYECGALITPRDESRASLTLPTCLPLRGVLPPACDESTAADTRWRLQYDVYQYFLPENDLSQRSLFSSLQAVADVRGLTRNGRRVRQAAVFQVPMLSTLTPPPCSGHDPVVNRPDHGGIQLHPWPGRHLLRRRQRPPAEHLGLLRARPHLWLQFRLDAGQLPDAR